MIARRILLAVLLALVGLGLQTVLLGSLTLAGTKPDLLLVVVVALAMIDGPALGAGAGFGFGLLADVLTGPPRGLTALTYTIAGYVVGGLRAHVQTPSAWLPMGVVASATIAATAFYAAMSFMLGQETLSLALVGRRALFAAFYNALLTPFVFPIVRALVARAQPRSEVIR